MQHHSFTSVLLIILCTATQLGCSHHAVNYPSQLNLSSQLQKPLYQSISHTFDSKPRRKWDTPIVADFDGDGFNDVLLNEHGAGIKISWNNHGSFATPVNVPIFTSKNKRVFDLHGISVGDINGDNNVNILVSLGGGSGTNLRSTKILSVSNDRIVTQLKQYDDIFMKMRGRTNKLFDGDNDGDLDILFLGFPPKGKQAPSQNVVFENDGRGNFKLASSFAGSYKNGQKIHFTDFNHDGVIDIFVYGNKHVKAFSGNGKLGFTEVTATLFTKKISHVTAIAELDIDNDGIVEYYFSRANELDKINISYDEKNKNLAFLFNRQPHVFNALNIGDIFEIENYQSPWPDFEIYIGEGAYQKPLEKEKHSGKSFRIVNSDGLGFPEKLKGPGLYIGYIGNGNWKVQNTTKTPVSGVIKNVSQYVGSVNDALSDMEDVILSNSDGVLSSLPHVSNEAMRLNNSGVIIADVNNDQYQDLIILHRGNMATRTQHTVMLNDAGNGLVPSELVQGLMHSELGVLGLSGSGFDFDNDGDIDILYGNDRGRWHLFEHTGATNNFTAIEIGHSPATNGQNLHASATVVACGNTQIQTINSNGSPYSQSANNRLHFGLGACQKIDSITIRWSNREIVKQTELQINHLYKFGTTK